MITDIKAAGRGIYAEFMKMKKMVDNFRDLLYNMSCVGRQSPKQPVSGTIGVWLSLARVLDLGSRGRRFKSCHPDLPQNMRV